MTGCEKQTGRADYNTKVEEKYNGDRRRRGAAEEADRALRSARRHTRSPPPAPCPPTYRCFRSNLLILKSPRVRETVNAFPGREAGNQ